MEFQDKEQCKGYFGFGTGYHLTGIKGRPGFCNMCPLAQKCWEAHRDRVRQLFPDLCKVFDDKLEEIKDPDKFRAWWIRNFDETDPYLSVMMGNMEDAQTIKRGGKVKSRGYGTLAYPFNTKN